MSLGRDRRLHEANRQSWNAATRAHNSHKLDQAAFFRNGGDALFPEELELLGDVAGKRLLHLQCNAGQDTLSLVARGACATGVDISDEAIAFAQRLSAETELKATFHRADVYDWLADARQDPAERYDIAFCSYGAICWLSDLAAWAAGLHAVLRPGGRFVTVDFHPVAMIFNERFQPTYPYFGEGRPLTWEEGVHDYVAMAGPALTPSGFVEGVQDFKNPHAVHEFQWHIGEILTSLLAAGFRIERFREYPYSNGAKLWENMQEEPGRRMYPPPEQPSLPLMFGLAAAKP